MEFDFILMSPPLVAHCSWPSQAMWDMHAPTFNKWHKKKIKNKNKKVTLHIFDTWRNTRVWVDFFGGLH